jgi:hypothetical protein
MKAHNRVDNLSSLQGAEAAAQESARALLFSSRLVSSLSLSLSLSLSQLSGQIRLRCCEAFSHPEIAVLSILFAEEEVAIRGLT